MGWVIVKTAFVMFLSVTAIRRGFSRESVASTKWYDRAINATGGILLLLFWAFLLIAYFYDPSPQTK